MVSRNYSSSFSSKSTSDKSISSSGGSSPSLPSQGSVVAIFGRTLPFTGAVLPLP